MGIMTAAVLGLAVVATQAEPTNGHARECRVVHARYAICADGDALWIVGSKHLLDVVIDDLDEQLEARGEDTVVFGDFTICAEHMGDPRYTHLTYRRRGFANPVGGHPGDTR